MAGRKQLAPVSPILDPSNADPGTVSAASTRLNELRAMRRVLATRIDHPDTLARDLAALVRQLRDISKEIEDLEPVEAEVSVNDDGNRGDSPFRLEAI